MFFSEDMKDLIKLFNKLNVEYVLVGGFAVNYYGYNRATQDIDFLIYPSKKNADKIMTDLDQFGFGDAGIPREYFEQKGSAIHLGVEPNRIDLVTYLAGMDNEQVFSNLSIIKIENIPIKMISYDNLIQAKKKSKRARDLADAEELEKIKNKK
jgi:predicted nucleotidyltransferase